jgi:DNA modification methylase
MESGVTWTVTTGDCLAVLREMAEGSVDAVVTDPPYGIGKDGQKRTTGRHGGRKAYPFLGWDSQRPPAEAFHLMLHVGRSLVIWGGNYFADLLPPTMGWLVWDKGQRINQSDGELAWTSRHAALRIFTKNRAELRRDGAVHPTQKPVSLMRWSIQQLRLKPNSLILDPFCGSGSTGVAALQEGHRFIGIEREPSYAEIARQRLDATAAELTLTGAA